MREKRRTIILCAALMLLAWAVYVPSIFYDFVNFDDPEYVALNPHVRTGFSWENIRWAWTARYGSMWCPLTWISHQKDVTLFGLHPAGHHAVNVLLHSLNAVLLFLALRSLTRRPWESAAIAALFAVHPLHVESVAWIAERKGLLSAFYGFAALWAYAKYARTGRRAWMAGCAALMGLSLSAKPVFVTLPLLLLLLDRWPLKRWSGIAPPARLFWEKTPLWVITAAASALTVWAHGQGGDIHGDVSRMERLFGAAVSSVWYIRKLFVPSNLAVFYPYPEGGPPAAATWAAALLVCALTVGALLSIRRAPFLFTGWCWFLIALAPMSGLVRYGEHARADRFAYVPLIGLYAALAWSAARLPWRMVRIPGAVVVIAALSLTARAQLTHWRNAETLWARAMNVTEYNYLAPMNRGNILMERGRWADALPFLKEAVRLDPNVARAQYNLGFALASLGREEEADRHFLRALDFEPLRAGTHVTIGRALARHNRMNEAERRFRAALAMEPTLAEAQVDLAAALAARGRYGEALAHLDRALALNPDIPRAAELRAAVMARKDSGS